MPNLNVDAGPADDLICASMVIIKMLRPSPNSHSFAGDIFKFIFLYQSYRT